MTVRLARLGQGAAVVTACLLIGVPAGARTPQHIVARQGVVQLSARPPRGTVGNDVGDLSCSGSLPTGGSFGVVGATAGKPFHRSPCLAAEYEWARGLRYRPQFYVNLADPGHKSAHWGHGGPRACHRSLKYDVGCAYDYGYETAAAAWGYVRSVGSDGHARWWLDVEVDNTWGISRAGIAANIADLRGALHYLRARHHTTLGIYTETSWWMYITNDSRDFSHVPVWGGGAGSQHNARLNCRAHSITGDEALLSQWIVGTVDRDIAC